MFKRLINFLLLANGITPAGHQEKDKWARVRAEQERERQNREPGRQPQHPAPPSQDAHSEHRAG